MSAAPVIEALRALLWPGGDLPTSPQVYAILDAARDREVLSLLRASRLEFDCLYGINTHPRLVAAAPHLVHLGAESRRSAEIIERAWGRSWGVFLVAPPDATIKQLRRHLRGFLRVQTEEGGRLVFRFYDPRVLRVFLPTCTEAEARTFFGPILRFACEDESASRLLTFAIDRFGIKAAAQAIPVAAAPGAA